MKLPDTCPKCGDSPAPFALAREGDSQRVYCETCDTDCGAAGDDSTEAELAFERRVMRELGKCTAQGVNVLAKALGASEKSVRRALRSLAMIGAVRSRRRDGSGVVVWSHALHGMAKWSRLRGGSAAAQ